MYKTIEQIEKNYNGQWVFMINCIQNEKGRILGGEVVLNSENRNNVIRQMKEADNKISLTSIRYVRNVPEGVAFL